MQTHQKQANTRTVKKTVLVVVAMFSFGFFVLPPLYDVICDVFGLGGRFVDLKKTEKSEYIANVEKRKDLTRTIRIEFLTTLNQKLNWEFRALQNTIDVHPGEVNEVMFYAKNLTDKKIIAQAIPSIMPGRAVKYFSKMECFCFSQQTFAAGEAREMPLRFYVDPDLPKDILTISLGYTFFNLDRKSAQRDNGKRNITAAGL